jgi:transposase
MGSVPKTGYKWKERFEAEGLTGMEDQSRGPHGSPEQLKEKEVCEIVRLKMAHPYWGPRKIQALYRRQRLEAVLRRSLSATGCPKPSAATTARLLPAKRCTG